MINRITPDNIQEWADEMERISKNCFEEFLQDHKDDFPELIEHKE